MRYHEIVEGKNGPLPKDLKLELLPDSNLEGCWIVIATMAGEWVGELRLSPARNDKTKWSAMNVMVRDDWRRRGIASAMYSYAHTKGIKPIIPDSKLSDDGHALWNRHLQPKLAVGRKPKRVPREWNPRRANIVKEAPHGIEGLPDHVDVKDHGFQQALKRGAFNFKAKPGYRDDQYVLANHPAGADSATMYKTGRRDDVGYYDPEHAEIEVLDPDTIIARTIAKSKAHVVDEIEDMGEGMIYRGMSAEEYESFLKTGQIKSNGGYNLGGQEGLTYWTQRASEAVSYANGFAPWAYKPTFKHPAYVVVAKRPDERHIRHIEGVGPDEVGVTRAITADEVVGVWRGKVIIFEPGSFEVNPPDWQSDSYRIGSLSSQRVSVHWERIK